jgi:hypothetical protein
MIDIFKMNDDVEYFEKLALDKMKEEKYAIVVNIAKLFPKVMPLIEATIPKVEMGIRRYLMACLIEQNDITSAKLLIHEEEPLLTEDKVFLIRKQFFKVGNAKKAALLIKEFELGLDIISTEFDEIEHVIISDSMNFFMGQFGVSFKHYSQQNILRLADYLMDYSPQKYGKPLAFLIERLIKHGNLDEAK